MTGVSLRDPLLTVPQVCEALGRKPASVFKLLKSQQLKSVKIGRSRRVRQSDLDAFIADLPTAPGGRPCQKERPVTRDALLNDWLAKARHIDKVRTDGKWPAWSTGETLAVALILDNEDMLAGCGYTRTEALNRVRYDIGAATAEAAADVFAALRARLTPVPVTRYELADMIADYFGRSVEDFDLELADQIAAKLGVTLDPDKE